MSLQLFRTDVLFYQRFLKANGFYKKELDGKWGKNTDAADTAFIQKCIEIKTQHGEFHARSEENIITLAPKAQILARKFLKQCVADGLDARIISGTRTYAEQNALYAIGRTTQLNRSTVTNAKGGQSNHNFGLAWDIGIFVAGEYQTKDAPYNTLGKSIKTKFTNLEWGGDWVKFKDNPHYQITALKSTVAEVKNLFEAGVAYI